MSVYANPGASRIRILFVEKGPTAGGSVVSLYHLVKGLDRSRFEPVILLADDNPYAVRFRALGLQVLTRPWGNRPPKGTGLVDAASRTGLARRVQRTSRGRSLYHGAGFYLKAFPEIVVRAGAFRRLVREVSPDIIHLNDALPINRGEVLGAWWEHKRMLIHARGFEPLNHFDRWLSRRVDHFVFISKAVQDDFLTRCGAVRAHGVVYNGVDPRELDATPEQAARVRQEWGVPDGARVGVLLGRIVAWKGQHVFVQALTRLTRSGRSVFGAIVGAPDRQSADYARSIQELITREGMAEHVRLFGFRSDVGAVLKASDVVVHASIEPEPFGRVIIEGMAAGRPVVATNVGGVPELVDDEVSGLLTPPGDVEALARAIERILDDSGFEQRLVEGGRGRVAERFSIEAHVRDMTRVYEALAC